VNGRRLRYPLAEEKGGFRLVGRHKSKAADTGTAVLGERVRQLRKARGLTLKDLGAAAGLSHGFLSQLERGQAQPSLSTLDDIAAALGIDTAALVSPTSSGLARHVRRADAPTYSFDTNAGGTVTVRALTGPNSLMKVTENVGSFTRSEGMAHPGEEVVYIVEGEVEIEIGGKVFLLRAGDVLNFDCSVEHTYRAVGETPPRFLVIAADPGQFADPVDERVYESRRARRNGTTRTAETTAAP
jgi:transcriptional regulator with XRE-family HTH domain